MVRTSKRPDAHDPDWALEPHAQTPLHVQLAQTIRREIQAGRWKPGDRIASERELMLMAGVSRATVRQALGTLMSQGILTRVHGQGTFVARPRFEQRMDSAYSFSQQIRAMGYRLDDRLLRHELVEATPEMAALLGVPAGEAFVHIQRLRLLEGVPLMVNRSYTPFALCPGLLNDSIGPSLYQFLAERYGLMVMHSTDTLEAIGADGVMAMYLHVPRGAPLMCVTRIAYTHGDQVLQLGYNFIRSDMCRFRVELGAPPAVLEVRDTGAARRKKANE